MGTITNRGLKASPTAFMLFLVVFFILSSIVMEVVAYLLIEAGVPQAIFSSMWYMILQQFVRLLLPLFIWLRITKDSFKAHMPNRRLDLVNIIYIFFFTLLAMPAVMLVSAIMTMLTDNVAADMMGYLTDAGHPWWLLMLTIAVTPAIVEELVFRGYIQSVQRGTILKVCLFNGFLFGLMHLNFHQFAYTFIVGVGWAYIVYITKSVWAGVWSHFIMNGANVTLLYWTMSAAGAMPEGAEEMTLAESMRDAFIETDPELAQRVYEFFYGIDVNVFAIVVVGLIAIPTAIGAFFVFKALIRHNAEIAMRLGEVETEATEETEETPEEAPQPRIRFDWCLALVIVIFIIFAAVLW